MPDPILTPANCAGSTCSVSLGRDLTSLTPSQLLAIVNRDDRTIVCEGGTGLKFNICNEAFQISNAALSNDTSANMLRYNEDCSGYTVQAPLMEQEGDGTRRGLVNTTNATSASAMTLPITNNDFVDRLFTIKGKFSLIVQSAGVAAPMIANVAYQMLSSQPIFGGGTTSEEAVTMTYQQGFPGETFTDIRGFQEEIILSPGSTANLIFRGRTIFAQAVDMTGANLGFNVTDVVVRSEQVRTS